MAEGKVYEQGWRLDDVSWERFDASKVQSWLLTSIKASALVEYNAPDYVTYLQRIFQDAGPETHAAIETWGQEESQHGRALARWASLADPSFDLEEAFARFRKGYRPTHFEAADTVSVRGSRRGEMVSRCVVESGTSTFYTAIQEANDEPVLKEIAGRIAADEFRHYKLFYETLHKQDEPKLTFWKMLRLAAGRITESDDDEIAYAYYCVCVPASQEAAIPYVRERYARMAVVGTMRLYRRRHIDKLVQMVAKAIGAKPHGLLAKAASAAMWRILTVRASLSRVTAGSAA